MDISYFVPHSPHSAGYENYDDFLAFAQYHQKYCQLMERAGNDVEFVYLGDRYRSFDHEFGHRIVEFPRTYGNEFGKEYSIALLRYLSDLEADVIHVHGYRQLNVAALLPILGLKDVRVFVQNHGSEFDYSKLTGKAGYRALAALLSSTVERVISVNEFERENLIRAGMDPSRVAYLPNGVDTDRFSPMDRTECLRELGLPTDDRYLVCVAGRLQQCKGVTHLVRAMDELRSVDESLRLLLVYGGYTDRYLRRIESLISDLRLDDHVELVGKVGRDRLPLYYNGADICVFPSVNEGFGVVTIEAMSCGRPVVGTSAHEGGGHLSHGENALLAETASTDSLVDRIERLLADGELYEEIRENGYASVQENYSWDAVGDDLKAIYDGRN